MEKIDRAKISALIDGELSQEEAELVYKTIAEDESLRREYEEITKLNGELKSYARTVMFRPEVTFPKSSISFNIPVPIIIFAILILRLFLKLIPSVIGGCLEIIVLGFVVTLVLKYLIYISDQERQLLLNRYAMLGKL